MNIAYAQVLGDINNVAEKATNIGNLVVELAISLSVVWIIISVVRYLIAGGSPEKRAEGGKAILYGVVGLFVILSIWGLVAILRSSFVTNDQAPDLKQMHLLPGSQSTGSASNDTWNGGNQNGCTGDSCDSAGYLGGYR